MNGDDQELELLKAQLDNRISGMMIAAELLSDDEKNMLLLLQHCKSVLDRIEPISEWGSK